MKFDSRRALEQAAKLSYPRFCGSEGEKRASRQIAEALKASGCDVSVEDFSFSSVPSMFVPKVIPPLIACAIGVACLLLGSHPRVSLGIAVLVFISPVIVSGWNRIMEGLYDLPADCASQNVVGVKRSANARANVVFLAHYDTKSQSFPLFLRLGLFLFFVLGSSVAAAIVGAAALNAPLPWIHLAAVISSIALMALAIVMQANTTGDASPGAVDNASSVGVMLELARCSAKEDVPVNVFFVATGAEEMGMAGALRFIQRHKKDFSSTDAFVNMDGLGCTADLAVFTGYGLPPFHRNTASKLGKRIRAASEKAGVALAGRFLLPGAGLDQLPIGHDGFECVTLQTGGCAGGFWRIHSSGDTAGRLREEGLKSAGELCVALIESA
jgi:hypothetical protein